MALNSSNFQILVNAVLDAKNIQVQLDKISQKYALMKVGIDVDTSKLTTALNNIKGMKVGFDEVTTSAEKTSQSIGDIFAKVSKFGGVTLVINELRQSLMDGVEAVKDLDAAVTEYKKVSDITDEGMKQYIEDAREMGLQVGRTATEALEAAGTFKKMGYSDQESLQLAKIASMFQNVADTAITAGESASFVNSQLKAFSFTSSEAEHVISAVNEVANNFALGTNDLAQALQTSASGIAVLGNSFEDTIGMITAGLEIMPGQASKIGRSVVSFGNNLAKTAQSAGELTYNVQGTAKSLSLLDSATGETKSTMQILKDLKSDWDAMTDSERQSIALTIGSKTQFSSLSAILQNLDSGVEASKTALNSQGSALKENARYLDSIKGKVSQFTSELQKFWTEGISSDFVKRLVEFGTQVVKLINDLGGMPTVLTAIGGAIVTLNGYNFAQSITKIADSVLTMAINFDIAFTATGSLTQAFTSMAGASTLVTGSLGAISLVITALVAAYNSYNTQQENARRATEQASQSYEEEREKLSELRQEYISAKDATGDEEENKKKLKTVIGNLAKAYGVEEEALADLNGTRAEGLNLLSQESAKKAQEYLNLNQSEIQKAQKEIQKMLTGVTFDIPVDISVDTASSDSFKQFYQKYVTELGEGVNRASGGYKGLIQDLNNTITAMQQEDNQTAQHQKALSFLSDTLVKLQADYEKWETTASNAASAYVETNNATQSFLNSQYESVDAFKSVYDALLENNTQIPLFKEALDKAIATNFPEFAKELGIEVQDTGDKAKEGADGVDDFGESVDEATSATEEFEKALKSLSGSLSDVQDAYDTLKKVADDYNSTGQLSVDNVADLLKVNPEYLSALEMVDGQLVVNNDTLTQQAQNLADASLKMLEAEGYLTAFSNKTDEASQSADDASKNEKSLGEAIQNAGIMAQNSLGGIFSAGSAAQTAGNQASTAAGQFNALATAMSSFSNAVQSRKAHPDTVMAGDEDWASDPIDWDEYRRTKSSVPVYIDTTEKKKKSSGGGGGSSKSSTSDAEKQAKADARAYKEAFEKELADLDKQKSSMKDNASTDKWYYEQLDQLTDKYYKDKEGYEEEYNKYHEKALNGMTKAHESAYDERYDLLKHQLAMDMISEEEYYDELEELMKEFYSDVEKYSEQRWKIEEEIYSGRSKLEEEATKKTEEEAEKRKKLRKEEWEEEKEWYELQQSKLETAFSYISSLAQKEIDALNERKQAVQDQYDAEIEAIEAKDEALEDEIELQEKLDALAQAQQKKVRIYREGEGFVYESDQSAVDEAKSALTQYKKEQQTKAEKKRLEEIKEATIDSIETQIKYWETYQNTWGEVTSNYTDEQNKLIAEQVLGISLEGENWEKRLGNLQDYVDRYNEIMSTLKTYKYYDEDEDDDEEFGDELDPEEYWSSGDTIESHGSGGDNWYEDDTSHGPGAYANGTTKGYGLSMVGEKGRELRVLGSGTNEGDGIIPNHLTENLMQLGKFSPSQWLNSIIGKVGGQSSNVYNYAFENLSLPNVTNGQSFINELKNLKNRALQMGGKRD